METNIKHVDFRDMSTSLYVDFYFYKNNGRYHIVNREISLYILDENQPPEYLDVDYYYVRLNLKIAEPKPIEISKALVNFLGKHKIYLKRYIIRNTGCYVSYETPKNGAKPLYDLPHNPFRHEQFINIEAEIQLDDNTDYNKLLDIKIKDPIDKITEKELKDLGYSIKEPGMAGFAILNEEDFEKYFG